MTIETKYNIGDEVWFMEKNKACSRVIEAIRATHYGGILTVLNYGYYLHPERPDARLYWFDQHERELYPTKEELLKSL